MIRALTGEKNIRYQDIVYLKEKLRRILLGREEKNIQMLTCFSLKNVLNGLTILLEDTFKYSYDLRTIVLDSETGEIIEEIQGSKTTKFALDVLNKSEYADCPILFEISIDGKGTIIMDMFSRSSKFN